MSEHIRIPSDDELKAYAPSQSVGYGPCNCAPYTCGAYDCPINAWHQRWADLHEISKRGEKDA